MTKLRIYQKQGIRRIDHFNGRVLLADEMGLGKTLQALYYLKRNPLVRPAVIVCPASLKWVWETQAHEHCRMRTIICNGRKPPKKRLMERHPILILNYDILHNWRDYLLKLDIQCWIFDECHYLKNPSAQRTKAAKDLTEDTPHILALSGTPLTNRPAELFPTLQMLWPKVFPAFWPYGQRYCDMRITYWGKDFSGAAHLDELHNRLKSLGMIRRLKKDVLKELPQKQRHVIPLEINNRSEYNKATNDFILWLKQKDPAKAKRAERAKTMVQMAYLKRLAAEGKMLNVFAWIDDFLEGSDSKLVVYCHHRSILALIQNRYKNRCVVIQGDTPQKQRKQAVEQFQRHANIRLFIGNEAAIEGITLTAANTLAFVEQWFSPGKHSQAEDRIHRIGQDATASIYYLVAKGTIEERLCRIIQKKQDVLTRILDGERHVRQMKMNIYDQLTIEMLEGKKDERQ